MRSFVHRLVGIALSVSMVATTADAATRLDGPFDDTVASYTLVANGDMEAHSGSTLSSWSDGTGGLMGFDSRAAYGGSGSAGLLDQTWTNSGSGIALGQSVSVTHRSWYMNRQPPVTRSRFNNSNPN